MSITDITSSTRVLRKRACREENENGDPNRAKSRRIHAPNATSSRTSAYSDVADLAQDKACRRVFGQYVDAVIQEALDIQVRQGKTTAQGARGTVEHPACHWCPNAGWRDDAYRKFKEKIIQNGVTPNQTARYLKAKEVDTPTRDLLDSKRGDPESVEQILKACMTPQTRDSVLARTHYDNERNATLDMPVESNRVDSQLEKEIRPFLVELANRKLTPEESTRLYIEKLNQFYTLCIQANESRIRDLELYTEQESLIQSFHSQENPSMAEFAGYLDSVKSLLECKKSLLTSIPRTSSCREIKHWREDYYWLEKLVNYSDKNTLEDTLSYFQTEVKPYLRDDLSKNSEELVRKYIRYIEEAHFQQKELALFSQVKAIKEIRKLIFGEMNQGVLKTPDETRVRNEVFRIIQREPRSSGQRAPQAKKGLDFSQIV